MSTATCLSAYKSSSPSPVNCGLAGWYLFEYIIFCIVIWWIVYLFVWIISRQSEEWTCRLLTFIHGSVVSYRALRDIFCNWNQMLVQNTHLENEQKSYLSFMLSYFVFDFMWIQIFGKEPWIIHFHHISSILVIIKIIMSDFGGLGMSFGVAGLEFTNPYLQLRWFLRTYGFLNKPIHMAVELWFFFLFFTIRLGGGSILFYTIQKDSNVDKTLKILITCIYLVSLALAWDILMYIKKKYFDIARIASFSFVYGHGNYEAEERAENVYRSRPDIVIDNRNEIQKE